MVERISMEEGDDGKKAATANHGDKGGRLAAELLGGTVGGILQVLVGHPLDTVKVRMQSSSYYRGVWHCMSETAQKEGLRGFYKGVGPPIVMSGALNAALFGTNGFMKRVVATAFDTRPDALSMPQVVLAAVMTAPVYCTILAPVEMIKCRLQVQRFGAKRQYSGPFDVIRQTIAHDGIKGIFAGYRITVLTRLVGSPFYFVSYEFVKKQLLARNEGMQLSKMQTLMAGGLAGAMFWTGNYPVDALRTRIQVSPESSPPIIRTAANIIRTEGVRALYRGYTACLIRSAPANAAVFFGVETTLNLLGHHEF